MSKFFLVLVILLLSACSNRAVYETMQSHEREECAKGPAHAYQSCLEATQKPFEEYERERNEAISR